MILKEHSFGERGVDIMLCRDLLNSHYHGIDGGYQTFPLLHGKVEDNAVQNHSSYAKASVQEPRFLKWMITVWILRCHTHVHHVSWFFFSVLVN